MSQLGQFYLCLLHVPCVLYWEKVFPVKLGWLQVCVLFNKLAAGTNILAVGINLNCHLFLQMVYHITMVALFSDFYSRTYAASASNQAATARSHYRVREFANAGPGLSKLL